MATSNGSSVENSRRPAASRTSAPARSGVLHGAVSVLGVGARPALATGRGHVDRQEVGDGASGRHRNAGYGDEVRVAQLGIGQSITVRRRATQELHREPIR